MLLFTLPRVPHRIRDFSFPISKFSLLSTLQKHRAFDPLAVSYLSDSRNPVRAKMHVFKSPTSSDKDTESLLVRRLSTPISRPRRHSGMVNSSHIYLINRLLFSLLLALLATCIVAYGIGTHACLASGGGASSSSPMAALSCLWATQDQLPPEQQPEPELVPERELMEETGGWGEAEEKAARKSDMGSTMGAEEDEGGRVGGEEGKRARGRGRWTWTVERDGHGVGKVGHLPTVEKGVARPESGGGGKGSYYRGTLGSETEDEWQRRAVGTEDGF
ncbi:hypothetical protein EV356DRAFT_499434 [Viridothelium virens]|uniref:Uncharacterized protein n=1 Tax=Viridothelium virens TaxID=1048519 RepID=A0A6A6HCD2_VIRVR|nr:hypothetical protein EV356DRAFT_499434 [Viridothelium virens]